MANNLRSCWPLDSMLEAMSSGNDDSKRMRMSYEFDSDLANLSKRCWPILMVIDERPSDEHDSSRNRALKVYWKILIKLSNGLRRLNKIVCMCTHSAAMKLSLHIEKHRRVAAGARSSQWTSPSKPMHLLTCWKNPKRMESRLVFSSELVDC